MRPPWKGSPLSFRSGRESTGLANRPWHLGPNPVLCEEGIANL